MVPVEPTSAAQRAGVPRSMTRFITQTPSRALAAFVEASEAFFGSLSGRAKQTFPPSAVATVAVKGKNQNPGLTVAFRCLPSSLVYPSSLVGYRVCKRQPTLRQIFDEDATILAQNPPRHPAMPNELRTQLGFAKLTHDLSTKRPIWVGGIKNTPNLSHIGFTPWSGHEVNSIDRVRDFGRLSSRGRRPL
jgi:hypothetical protein